MVAKDCTGVCKEGVIENMDSKYLFLLAEARKAINKGFYAEKKPERRYGAAVLSINGKVYSAGQYSSYNHITSIHAEMSAILLATMNGEPDIEAIALSCSKNEETFCCGICLQFIKEHAMRTQRDITLIFDREEIILVKQSEVTKNMW